MQRPFTKKNDIKEFYELRDVQPQQPQQPLQSQQKTTALSEQKPRTFTIPSSSRLKEDLTPAYVPERQAYMRNSYIPTPLHDGGYTPAPRNIHCIVIADHIIDCPICSRLYRNYTPIYNTIIGIMLIALIVLIIKYNRYQQPRSMILSSSPQM